MTRPRQIALALATVAVIIAAIASVVVSNNTDEPTTGSATVYTPQRAGGAPLVIMPAAFGQSAAMYRPIARRFAESGYVVVAYAQRGFEGSGGRIDLAGPRTQADVSDVVDWALRTQRADKSHVGAFGISYGAGVSLLAAAKDKRIRAVVALSTWTDLAASFDPNDTPNTLAISTLFRSASSVARLDSTTTALRNQLEKSPARLGATIKKISPTRSPANYLAALNANKPAIFLANGYQDSLFGPGQLVPFFDRLTTEKRLQLANGDHGGPEASALQGKQNSTVDDGQAWLDRFLRDTDNGIDTDDPIVLTDATTGGVHTYKQWPRTTTRDVVPLGAPGSKNQTGTGIATTWKATIGAGADSAARSGGVINPFGTYQAPKTSLINLSRSLAFAWTGPAVDRPTLLSGTPSLRLPLSASKTSGTVVSYLYDVDDKGVGQLISMQPYSFRDLPVGSVRDIDLELQPVSWTLRTGHRFVFVVDTEDARFTSLNPAGARLNVTSNSARPARAIVPFG